MERRKKGANGLTPKQEAFCQEYIANGGNATQAWIKAYNKEHVTKNTAYVNSLDVKQNPRVQERIKELQSEIKSKFDIKVEDIVKMLMEDRDLAKQLGSAAASVSAAMGIAKVAGLLLEKVDHTSSDGSMATPKEVQYKLVK